MTWQKLPKPSTLWEEGEKWFELEDNLTEGKFDFLEYKEEPLPRGTILQRDVSVAMGPEILGTPGDLSRIWVAFTDQETGEIYLARSDADWNQWEEYLQVIYAPSGSYQPSLIFGQDGWHKMAVTLVPAGEEMPEVWIIQPPYSGDGIQRLDLGEYPRIFQDYWGNTWVFYYKSEVGAIYSKSSKDNFVSSTEINLSNQGYPPLGVRIPYWEVTPYHDQFRNVLFFGSGENMPFYISSQIEDIYTVGLDLYITKWDGSPIDGAIAEVEGQSGITNKEGLVTFYKLPYNTTVEVKLSHSSLGLGDTQNIFIPKSAKGTHIFASLFFIKPKIKENLGMQTGLTGIEWIGTEFVKLPLQENLGLGVDLGIEWESMLIPTYVLVYSRKQIIYEQTHLLTYTNPTTTSKRESFVWESKGQISNQDVSVNIYTDSTKRPGIALRCTGSGGTENLYAGYYRHGSGNLEIAKYVNGTYTQLVTQSIAIQQEKWYSLRMQAEGSSIRLKIWDIEEQEPDNWNLQTTDTSISGGYAGLWDFDGSGTSKWSNFSLNGEEANWETASGGIPEGWSLQFGTAIRWTTETESIAVGFDYLVVPDATVQLGDQTSQTNQEGLAPFYELQGGSLQDYEITHPDYPGVCKGTILIPEGEFDFIPLKIYEKPWDGYILEEVKVHADLDIDWVAIDIEYRQSKESVSVSVGLTNILWVGVTE